MYRRLLIASALILSLATGLLVGQERDIRADKRFNAVTWTQNAAEYRAASEQAYRYAQKQLHSALADPNWTADEVQQSADDYQNKLPAVILDLDETVLDNSAYNARGIVAGTDYDLESWNEWCLEEKALAVAGAAGFIARARALGIKVFFVTNRRDIVKTATINNLNNLGIPATANEVMTRNDDQGRGGDKISRRALVANDHRILLLIGDNMHDMCSGMNTTDRDRRNRIAVEKSAQFAGRWIVIPNPMYGGWERALGRRPLRLQTEGAGPVPFRAAVEEARRAPRDAAAAPETIRVGAWNIETLGSNSSRQDPVDLAEKIAEMNCDVLALQEIYVTARRWRSKELNQVIEELNENDDSANWKYLLFRNRKWWDKVQVTGVAWNANRVTLEGEPYRIQIEDRTRNYNEWFRNPYAVRFSAGEGLTDFVVISLHMKAGKKDPNVEQRSNEAAMLIAKLDDVREEMDDDDLILIGDTNVRRRNERALSKFEEAGFRDLYPGGPSTVSNFWLDRALVSEDSPEFDDSEQTIMSVPRRERSSFRRRYSDHFPIFIDIRIGEDDD